MRNLSIIKFTHVVFDFGSERDLFDLYELSKMGFNWDNIVGSFKLLKIGASRKQFEKNLALKMTDDEFLEDILPLLPNKYSYNTQEAYEWFLQEIIPRMD